MKSSIVTRGGSRGIAVPDRRSRLQAAVRLARHRLTAAGRDAGMTTAEYAVGTIAACAFAAVLIAIVKSDGIGGLVTEVITTALSVLL